MSLRNFAEPVTFVRSPTLMKACAALPVVIRPTSILNCGDLLAASREREPSLDRETTENRHEVFEACSRQQLFLPLRRNHRDLLEVQCVALGNLFCDAVADGMALPDTPQELGLSFAGHSDTVDDRERGAGLQSRAYRLEESQLGSIIGNKVR